MKGQFIKSMPQEESKHPFFRPVVRLFLKVFVPTALAFAAVITFFINEQLGQDRQRLLTEEQNLTLLEENVFESSLAAHIDDASFLATVVGHLLRQAPGQGLTSPVIKQTFQSFAKTNGIFSQHRILDNGGLEKLRINCNPLCAELLPDGELQDKSNRDYFIYSIAQSPGDVYVSPLDLNVEHGKIERPLNPTLRLASAIAGPDGQNAGVVVLNYKGDVLLDRMRQLAKKSTGKLYFTDSEGHWIIGPSRDVEWSHSLPERPLSTFPKMFPKAWKTINEAPKGQFTTENGLFTFIKAHAHHGANNAFDLKTAVDRGWVIVSHVASERLTPSWLKQAVNTSVVFVLTLAVIFWLWAAGKTRQKLASEAIYRQEQLVSAIGRSSHDAIAVVDADDQIIFWNQSAEKMFGYPGEEALGSKLHQLVVPGELRQDARRGFETFRNTGQGTVFDQSLEHVAIRRDGSEVPVEIVAASMTYDGQWFAVGIMRDITQRKLAEKRLRELATIDGLTGVANRRYFTEKAQEEINRTVRYGGPLSLIMFDVDHFKKVNDTYGHDAGDEVLKQLCLTAGQSIRDVDFLGRLGGEEFAVLMPETGPEAAKEVANRLRAAVEKSVAQTAAGPVSFTISLGVASTEGDEASLADLLKDADNAMYQAKREGRNLVRVA